MATFKGQPFSAASAQIKGPLSPDPYLSGVSSLKTRHNQVSTLQEARNVHRKSFIMNSGSACRDHRNYLPIIVETWSMEELRKIATAVGIDTKGKSAEQLSTLITEAATRSSEHTTMIDPKVLSKHFEEGRFTDCTIRVKIGDAPAVNVDSGPPAKRLRSGRSQATKIEGPADQNRDVRVIQSHAVSLASCSAYFERAMGGEWRESQDRSFEVEVADETEYATFRRLIKLCYGSTCIKEGGRDLNISELVRLIHVANAYECIDAVKQCATALSRGELDWEGAVQCLELTDVLEDVEGMEDLAEKVGDVIAKQVGPVHALFTPVRDDEDGQHGGDVLGGLRLSERVKALSPTALDALLFAQHLQIKTENETFWLLLSWVEAQSEESEEGKQELFTRMAKPLHFDWMDPGYILLMFSNHPRILAAGLQHEVTRASLIRANLARRASEEIELLARKRLLSRTQVKYCGGKPEWTFDVKFTTAEAAAIEPGEAYCKTVGLAAGLPWFVRLRQTQGTESEGGKLGVSHMCSRPFKWMKYRDGSGFYFQHKLEVGVGTPRKRATRAKKAWTEETPCGSTFAAWDEVFREGSDWLVNGELCVRLTVTTVNDQGP